MDKCPPPDQQVAEYAMALDLCYELAQVLDEDTVLRRILDIFSALFAPEQIVLWTMEGGTTGTVLMHPESGTAPQDKPDQAWTLPEITPAGFRLRIPYNEVTVAVVEVDGLAFPAHRERYLSLALAIAGVCGLAVSNARNHSRLEAALFELKQEYEKSSRLSRELQVFNEDLERKVHERTAELENTMVKLKGEILQRTAAEEQVRTQLAEKTLLLRELHHRVKNNLQIIMSMLSIQARKVTDPALQLALSESKNRIRMISAVHEKLWTAEDLSRISLPGLIRQIPAGLMTLYRIPPDRITISMDVAQIVVDINTAIPLALILNELFSNSFKHAFPAGKNGEIALEIREDADSILIRFADNGVGLPPGYDWENPETAGFLLVLSLVQQLQGTIVREEAAGTRFLIRFLKPEGAAGDLQGTYNRVVE